MSKFQPELVDRKVAFLGGLFFIGLTVALGIFAVWSLVDTHRRYAAWLNENVAVLIEDVGITIFYGSAPLLAALFVFGLYGIWIGITGRRSKAFDRRAIKPLSGLVVIGLICLFVGRYAGNTLWAENFQLSGYSQCQDEFLLTGKWAVRVWASSPLICMDGELKNRLRSQTHTIYDINHYYDAASSSLEGSSD